MFLKYDRDNKINPNPIYLILDTCYLNLTLYIDQLQRKDRYILFLFHQFH